LKKWWSDRATEYPKFVESVVIYPIHSITLTFKLFQHLFNSCPFVSISPNLPLPSNITAKILKYFSSPVQVPYNHRITSYDQKTSDLQVTVHLDKFL